MEKLSDDQVLVLLQSRYSAKQVVMYYLQKAHEASQRADLDITSQNIQSLIRNTQTMKSNIDMVYRILGDDKNVLDDKKSK